MWNDSEIQNNLFKEGNERERLQLQKGPIVCECQRSSGMTGMGKDNAEISTVQT